MATYLILIIGISFAMAAAVGPPPLHAGVPGSGGMRVLFQADSIYHHIVVAEDDEARYLRFDRSFQSGMLLRDPFESPVLYAAYAHLGLLFRPQARRVLVVGLGGGSIPKRFWRDYPEVTVEVAELDPMVVEVAKRFFEVREGLRLRIVAQDGRQFLLRSLRKCDIIILDAYFAESIPFHMTTVEFYLDVDTIRNIKLVATDPQVQGAAGPARPTSTRSRRQTCPASVGARSGSRSLSARQSPEAARS